MKKSYSKSKLFFPSIILFSFLVASCDPDVEYEKIVQNNSDYNVKVLRGVGYWYLDGTDTIFTPTDTLTIYKNTSDVIYRNGGIGGVYDYQDCWPFIDPMPMLVYYEDSVKLIPNIHKMNYWDFRVIKQYKNGGGTCECRIILTNEILAE